MPVFYVRTGNFYKAIHRDTKEDAAKAALESIRAAPGRYELGHVVIVSENEITKKIALEHTFFHTEDFLAELSMNPDDFGLGVVPRNELSDTPTIYPIR